MIYLSAPDVTDAEEAALVRAIRSGWVAPLGPEVDAFEAELAQYCGRAHAVALSSGTAALHLGLLLLGVRPGDVVICSSMTFAATANAIVYAGGQPWFVDSDGSANMNPDLLARALHTARSEGRRVGAVVPVDLFGHVVDHSRIDPLVAEAGVPMLCDAAESLGARFDGCESARFGEAAAVSFNGNKVMTTSGGGALLTDSADAAARVRYLATQARQPVPYYHHTEIGFNYRLSNLLAALGRAQLARLDDMIERRRALRLRYRELLAPVPGVSLLGDPGVEAGGTRDNYWLTSIVVEPAVAGFSSRDIAEALAKADIECRPLWKPLHLQPVFTGARAEVDGTGQWLFEHGVSLPSGSAISDAQVNRILQVLHEVVSGG
ncbi:Putative pyridoxal phosphate-dependent aminotransferase EpsN [Propionicimonas sp. T2.31MG-18]|uniref:DegT/DnrJ/EryC1/StrS family aminotransferase n=1 Tax=Propionicimonas sp. T2.31MG-18 TaxID=3157620 RepID=UPI0035E95EAF